MGLGSDKAGPLGLGAPFAGAASNCGLLAGTPRARCSPPQGPPMAEQARLVPSPWKATKTVLQVTLSPAPVSPPPQDFFPPNLPRWASAGSPELGGNELYLSAQLRMQGGALGVSGSVWVGSRRWHQGASRAGSRASPRHLPVAESSCVGACCPRDNPPRLPLPPKEAGPPQHATQGPRCPAAACHQAED